MCIFENCPVTISSADLIQSQENIVFALEMPLKYKATENSARY